MLSRITTSLDELPDILTRREAAAVARISLPTLWREEKAGRFPKGFFLSPGRKGYRKSDIERWIASRSAAPTVEVQ